MIKISSKLLQQNNNIIEISTSANGGNFKTQITTFHGNKSEQKTVKLNTCNFEIANNKHDEIVDNIISSDNETTVL